jgi:HSP20 family molecular chaperone IbpA
MGNKNIVLSIGFILVAIIAYLSYQLYKKEHQSSDRIIEKKIAKKDEPTINIKIDKTPSTKVSRSATTPTKTSQIPNNSSSLTEEEKIELQAKKVQEDMQELLKSIFASKEVQEGLKEFQKEAKESIKRLQEELENLPSKLDNLSNEMKKDPFFSEIIDQLQTSLSGSLKDMGDHYIYEMKISNGKDANIDITTKNNLLTIRVKSSKKSTTSQEKREIVRSFTIPRDAFVEKLGTKFENDILTITIPKVKVNSQI